MRRVFAGALISAFVLQSGAGAAFAGTARGAKPLSLGGVDRTAIAKTNSSGSRLVAQLTGQERIAPAMRPAAPAAIRPVAPRSAATFQSAGTLREMLARVDKPVMLHGARVPGPPMPTRLIDPHHAVLDPFATGFHTLQQLGIKNMVHVSSAVMVAPGPAPLFPMRLLSGQRALAPLASANQVQSAPAPTGSNPWWSFETGSIPGAGTYAVNVASGNLLVTDTDLDISERGIDLAFTRVYNSMSGRDWANDDGSPLPGQFGTGWTNTFDAHMAYNTGNQYGPGLSVFDADGARYDYLPDGQGNWTPPAGQYATLTWDTAAGYYWTKKDGTIFYFFSPGWSGSRLGIAGRLYRIYGRNHNNYLEFWYGWVGGDSSNAANLATIQVNHSDGHHLLLNFASFNSQTLLQSIVRPDGLSIVYDYLNGGLHGATSPFVGTATRTAGYVYNGAKLGYAVSPRYVAVGGSGNDGGYVQFGYDGSARIQNVYHAGVMNFTPPDGTNTRLQPNVTMPPPTAGATTIYRTDTYNYNNGSPTNVTDTDGHWTNWWPDTLGRVALISRWVSPSVILNTTQSWDAQNNLIATVEPRGNVSGANPQQYETDYAYDARGNLIAAALPPVSTSQGTFRPTTLISYDGSSNVTSLCDAAYVHTLGRDWTGNPGPSDSLCRGRVAALPFSTHFSWDSSDPNEPFGRLTDSYSPTGYHTTYAADSNGMPLTIAGAPYTQADGTNGAATETVSYDTFGNVICVNRTGNAAAGWTVLQYDSLNRLTAVGDPDDASISGCGKTPGIANSRIVSSISYNPDGSISTYAGPTAMRPASASSPGGLAPVAFTYDWDGDVASVTHQYGVTAAGQNNPSGTANYWYDGADRLVEVGLPTDATDKFYPLPWLTRYLYDLTQGQTNMVTDGAGHSQSLNSHGGLYSIQGYFGSQVPMARTGWRDELGLSHDSGDRLVLRFRMQPVPGAAGSWQQTSFLYDQAGSAGFLSQKTDPLGQSTTWTVDAAGRTTKVQYGGTGGGTPALTYTWDPDGRVASVASSQLTGGAYQYTYNADGTLATTQEPTSFLISSAGTKLTYGRYIDGSLATLSVSSPAFTQGNLFQYSHRQDGPPSALSVNYLVNGKSQQNFTWVYTPGGRVTSRVDPLGSEGFTYDPLDGVLTKMTLPAGQYSFTWDAEGEMLGYAAQQNNSGLQNWTVGNGYNARGEAVTHIENMSQTNFYQQAQATVTNVQGAFGIMNDDAARKQANGNALPGTYDYLDGLKLGDAVQGAGTRSWQYDVAGRESTRTSTAGPCPVATTYQFDSANRLVKKNVATNKTGCGNAQSATSYVWWPTDQIGSSNLDGGAPVSLHWDGNQLLFTETFGNRQDIKVGSMADIVINSGSASLVVYDRDPTGRIGSIRTAADPLAKNAGGLVLPGDPVSTTCGNFTCEIAEPGIDSVSDVMLGAVQAEPSGSVFQGHRTFDYSAGSWITPDNSPGTLADPISLKPYLHDRNNPNSFLDFSGDGPVRAECEHLASVQTQSAGDCGGGGGVDTGGAILPPNLPNIGRVGVGGGPASGQGIDDPVGGAVGPDPGGSRHERPPKPPAKPKSKPHCSQFQNGAAGIIGAATAPLGGAPFGLLGGYVGGAIGGTVGFWGGAAVGAVAGLGTPADAFTVPAGASEGELVGAGAGAKGGAYAFGLVGGYLAGEATAANVKGFLGCQ